MKSLLLGIVIVVAGGALALGYLGFVPALAGVFGSDQPRDLGITYSAADLQSANQKAGFATVALPPATNPEASLRLSGKMETNDSFTDRELTALINDHEARWKYYPVSDGQVRINPDGSVEASGVLRVDRAYGYAAATGVSADIVDAVVDRLQISNVNPPFYVKGTVVVENNRVRGEVHQAELGRFGIPANWISDNEGTIVSFLEDRIARAGISARSVTFANGAMHLDVTIPETIGFSAGQ